LQPMAYTVSPWDDEIISVESVLEDRALTIGRSKSDSILSR
jgi:hypothetical protein